MTTVIDMILCSKTVSLLLPNVTLVALVESFFGKIRSVFVAAAPPVLGSRGRNGSKHGVEAPNVGRGPWCNNKRKKKFR